MLFYIDVGIISPQSSVTKSTLKRLLLITVIDATGAPAPRGPQLGCQVVVQSEAEQRLAKQMRREEKRQQRAQARDARDAPSDSEEEEEFDPAALRAKRLQQLAAMQARPVFGPRQVVVPRRQVQEVYPNVYDSQNAAKTAAG